MICDENVEGLGVWMISRVFTSISTGGIGIADYSRHNLRNHRIDRVDFLVGFYSVLHYDLCPLNRSKLNILDICVPAIDLLPFLLL